MGSLPEPHPLDFDWRFSSETVIEISKLVSKDESVLAIGSPSIARYFQQVGREVALVDRQPFQCAETQIVLDINTVPPPVLGFSTAIVDPPWYPEQFSTWVAWAANCVGAGGTVFALIWPHRYCLHSMQLSQSKQQRRWLP